MIFWNSHHDELHYLVVHIFLVNSYETVNRTGKNICLNEVLYIADADWLQIQDWVLLWTRIVDQNLHTGTDPKFPDPHISQ